MTLTIGIVVTTLLLTICTHNSDSQMITQVTWTITPNTWKNTIYPNFYDAWLLMIRLKNNYKLMILHHSTFNECTIRNNFFRIEIRNKNVQNLLCFV